MKTTPDPKTIILSILGDTITLTLCGKSGEVTSTLHLPKSKKDYPARVRNQYNGAVDGIESLVLAHAHACAGIDVESPAYVEGLKTTVEAIGNNLL
jgi:ribosomal protein S30